MDRPRKCPHGVWISCAGIALVPALYVLCFGPACWISERTDTGYAFVSQTYRPIIWLATQSSPVNDILVGYASLGASAGSIPEFGVDGLEWWQVTGTPGSIRPFNATISCTFDANDETDSAAIRTSPAEARQVDGLLPEVPDTGAIDD